MKSMDEVLNRGVVNVIPGKDRLKKLLASGKKLNVYFGIDPTATRIHIGHAVPLRKLQAFVELGHNVTFLIGDFTALIGDTSDKESERPVLTYEEIQENFKTYKKQAEKFVDFSKAKVRFNSEWLKKIDFLESIKLARHFSFGDIAGRELIRKRLEAGNRVRLDEALYPVMQGYDSYYLDTDIQIGSADQTFNMQAGRILQKDLRGKESFVLVTDYLMGTDGRKMSKSWGNAIWIEDPPSEMYGKVMSLRDELINQYFLLATDLPEKEFPKGDNPLAAKKKLAWEIVKELHGKANADMAEKEFEKTFQKRGTPTKMPKIKIKEMALPLLDLVFATRMVKSRSEAKRLISQGAVEIDGKVYSDAQEEIKVGKGGITIKIGKKLFVHVTH